MKKTVLSGLLLFFCILSGAWAEQGPAGFNGIPWGAEIGQLSGFIPLREFRDYKFCKRIGEVDVFDGAKVEEIRYEFYKDRFYSAAVKFNGDQNFRLLLDGLLARYGAGEKRTNYMEEHEWSSENLNVILKYSHAQKDGSVEYLYRPIFDQITRDESCCTP